MNGGTGSTSVSGTPRRDIAVRSDAGAHRVNEDVLHVFDPVSRETVCLLADGLGGHGGGQTAATIAVRALIDALTGTPVRRDSLGDRVREAGDLIVRAREASATFADMRTTLVLLHLDAASAFWLHCGDSRLYHVRDGTVLARTVDHSLAAMQGDPSSDEADRGVLLRSLGGSAPGSGRPRVLRAPVPLEPGDRFLLCSDGFWTRLDEGTLTAPSADGAERWLAALYAGLAPAEPHAEVDDASAIAVRVGAVGPQAPSITSGNVVAAIGTHSQ